MLVVLTETVEGYGAKDDVINVSQADAEEYLIPRGLAVKAQEHEKEKQALTPNPPAYEQWGHDRHSDVEKIADWISKTIIVVKLEDEDDEVTAQDIANSIKHQLGFTLGAGRILLDEPITVPGDHIVKARPHRDIEFDVHLRVELE